MTARSVVIGADGRAKAYRPLPNAERARGIAAGLEAWELGDWFAAHEHLEPAWMGTDDLAERAWLQGLIKLAAAYVHLVRRNPAGVARNLEGARSRLVEATKTSRIVPLPGDRALDLRGLIDAIDQRLTDLADHPNGPTLPAPSLPYLDGRRTR